MNPYLTLRVTPEGGVFEQLFGTLRRRMITRRLLFLNSGLATVYDIRGFATCKPLRGLQPRKKKKYSAPIASSAGGLPLFADGRFFARRGSAAVAFVLMSIHLSGSFQEKHSLAGDKRRSPQAITLRAWTPRLSVTNPPALDVVRGRVSSPSAAIARQR